MSESGKVRIVRCPKCDNLLPEVSNYSVYQCGGCGAVLKAKNKVVDLDTFSEKSDEGKIGESLEKLSDRYEKMNVSEKKMSDGSESDVRSNISSSSQAEKRILRDRRENYGSGLSNQNGKGVLESDEIQQKEFLQAKVSQDFEDPTIWKDGDSLRNSGRLVHARNGVRIAKEDPSNLLPKSSYGYSNGNPMMTRDGADGFNGIDYAGDDRVELLRQLDELKDKLSRSGNLMPDGKETVGMNRHTPYQDPYASDSSSRYSYPNAQFQRPTYHNQFTEPPPLIDREEMGRYGFYPPQQHNPSNIRRYEDPSRSHMPNRRQDLPSRVYNSGPYVDDGPMYMAGMDPYLPNLGRHHPSCSCYECRNKRLATPSAQPASFNDNISRDTMFNYNAGSFGSRDYNHGNPDPRLRSRNSNLHNRWPSDVTSEVDNFARRRPPPRAHLASSSLHFRPLAGGAPFLTCRNCFEVLLLPKRMSTNRKKMRCSACSTVIVCTILNDSLVFSVDVEAKDTDDASNLKQGTASFSSDHYDNSGYDFKSMDRDSRNVSNEGRNFKSTSTYASEAEEDWKHSDSADVATKEKRYHMVGRSGEGNRSGRSENDKEFVNKTTNNRQVSKKESSATEIDLSSNEYGNTGSTFDSGEGSRGDHQSKGRRIADSFFAGILKKSSKDLSKNGPNSVEEERASTTVNGHLIPDRLIKKAEKLAGPIHPGNYWYDFRAGFWGAVGGPCLGIVPPFIEEFNYPMPEQCGGGNTHVFVNGRELNQKDLNLLASRGLPSESNRSYIVEISGRVLDEDTSEELEGLGKLAPTVEKAKRGFGMRDPNAVPR